MDTIYKITNKINNKAYIGYTDNPTSRWNDHKKGKGSQVVFQAINKYGLENITFEVIANDSVDNEDMYIQEHNTMYPNGYNLTPGGGMPPNYKGMSYQERYGDNWQDEIDKRRLSNKFKHNMPHTEETKRKISESVSGEKNPMFGRTHSEASKKLMSKNSPCSKGASNANSKTWCLTSPQGKCYTVTGTLRSTCEELGLSFATINASYRLNRPMRSGWKIELIK
jgi:group I intron endonuclease